MDKHILTDKIIENAKVATEYYHNDNISHEHPDCIRMAYEWLDAQKKIKKPRTGSGNIKHLVESWSGRYISSNDVEVACTLHPEIKGQYPNINISKRLTLPHERRLKNISEAFNHNYSRNWVKGTFGIIEK